MSQVEINQRSEFNKSGSDTPIEHPDRGYSNDQVELRIEAAHETLSAMRVSFPLVQTGTEAHGCFSFDFRVES
jgi:hypothetical protein